MENLPLISVVVPVYNVEQWLERCVYSICSQSYQNLEIILVDDGSTDNSGNICDELSKIDNRIKVIHKQNGGLSDARNAGLAETRGEYISFIDSDDWIEKEFIERLLNAIQQNSCDIAGCKYRKCSSEIHENISREIEKLMIFDKIEAMSELIDNAKIEQVVWNKLYDRHIIQDIMFEKGKYHEDEFWSYQVIARINRYVSINYVGYNYFQRENSIMGVGYSTKRLDAIEAKNRRQKFLEDNMPELAEKGRENLIFTCLYHGQLAQKSLNKNDIKKTFKYLKKIIWTNKLMQEDIKQFRVTHRFWIYLTNFSLEKTCFIRNLLKIGL